MNIKLDYITDKTVDNLSELFYERLKRSEKKTAYQFYDQVSQSWDTYTWFDIAKKIELWHTAFRHEGLKQGDRVAIMMSNCPDWVVFDQAAYTLGLVVVPIYTNDRLDNVNYILENSNIKILFAEDVSFCLELLSEKYQLRDLIRIITNQDTEEYKNERLVNTNKWLPSYAESIKPVKLEPDSLATIVYTSGTTGRPKGVMLSHRNIFANVLGCSQCTSFCYDDLYLSFLPLSHMFERTVGYYLPVMSGGTVAYARSIEDLGEDLINIKPTVLITVPRIFERVNNKIQMQLSQKSPIAEKLFNLAVEVGWLRFLREQKRVAWSPKLLLWPLLNKLVAGKIIAKLGGRMRLAISGGAPLSPSIAKTFIGLGLSISQGYGMTEISPVVSTNRLEDNLPFSVGQALFNVQVKLGENDELLFKGPSVMQGYWNNDEATKQTIDSDGWLHSGDKGRIDGEHIYITGRIKEILVLSNGEKVPPADIELTIATDKLIEQVLVIGEAKPYLTAIISLEATNWQLLAKSLNLEASSDNLNNSKVIDEVMLHITQQLSSFPGYANIHQIFITDEVWSIENGFLTPTLKIKRNKIIEHYKSDIEKLYEGH